ncbi:hypothetical protein ACE1CD_25315 [Aerosakkonema sp. BLCC-F183]|uniref:hypothetical protein n=1 Tax=Aerosakkonema sp. BLCC-F183 TaxID=3342834 RepID=UPI0035B7C0C8
MDFYINNTKYCSIGALPFAVYLPERSHSPFRQSALAKKSAYRGSPSILTFYVTLVNKHLKIALVMAMQMKIDAEKN